MKYSEEQITEAYENGTLYVKCLNTVSDDLGVYNKKDKLYEVIDEENNCWYIEAEDNCDCDEVKICKNDSDFELTIIDKESGIKC